MELKYYAQTMAKWWWLVVVCTLLAGAVGYGVSSYLPATYRASTSLLVNSGGLANADYNSLLAGQQLAATYTELFGKRLVIERTASQLGLDPVDVAKQVKVRLIPNTTVIELAAESRDPRAAMDIANGMVASFRQIMQESVGMSSRSLVVVERAAQPAAPVAPRKELNTAIAALAGLALSAGAAFAVECFDGTIETAEDVQQELSAAVLGAIPYTHDRRQADGAKLAGPGTPLADAHRALRIRIQASRGDGLHSLLITSPSFQEEPAGIVANLAVAMAQAGHKVLLLDADLRQPRLHKTFGVIGEQGLSTLLVSGGKDWAQCIVKTDIPDLHLLPAGPPAGDPLGLLDSEPCRRLFQELKAQADVILVSAPPVLVANDASSLASLVEGSLLVVASRCTRRKEAAQALEVLRNSQASVVGVVLDKVRL